MTYLDAIILALIQGLTEFLPISSSAHLIIFSDILGTAQNLFLDVSLHLGTLIAVCIYFKKDLIEMFNGMLQSKSFFKNQLFINLAVSCIPTLFLGFLFVNLIDSHLRNTLVISLTTIGFALVLFVATFSNSNKTSVNQISLKDALIIGLAQSLSLIPGTSRSGITISAGLLLGLDNKTASKFSFLMAVPTISAIAAYQLFSLDLENLNDYLQFSLLGLVVSFIVAYFTIDFFIKFINRIGFIPFILYRLVLGLALLLFFT